MTTKTANNTRMISRLGIFAVFLFLAQLFFSLSFAPSSTDMKTYYPITPPSDWSFSASLYQRLNNWDSFHYFEIVKRKYHIDKAPFDKDDIESFKVNGGFFPGYPAVAWVIQGVSGVSTQTALLFAAHAADIVFWIYFFLLLDLWKVRRRVSLTCAVLVFAYPGSFFMVAGYSESLFCATLIGFIYWSEKWLRDGRKMHSLLAGLHGFLMSATRLFALPVLLYPCVQVFMNKRSNHLQRGIALGITAFSCFGALGYLMGCQIRFGAWNHYMIVQQLGWGNVPSYFALFNPLSYLPKPFFEPTMMTINRVSIGFNLAVILGVFAKDPGRHKRIGIYFAAGAMFYMAVTAKANSGYDSLSRYTLPVFVLALLAWAQSVRDKRSDGWLVSPFSAACVFVFLIVQAWIAYRFLHGKWVT